MRAQEPPIPNGTAKAVTTATPDADDPRVIQAVQDYLAALEGGHRLDRQAFLARHAEIAGPLAECLDALEFVHTVGPRLEEPAPVRLATESAAPELAVPLGDFRILREIGRGGMGIVYEAEQLSLGRRIALKVLPFALTLDPRQLQRFKNEARAAAHLHHTNIVPIYSVGCERGVHFYAMQYVEGRSLATVIRELRELAGLKAADTELTGSGPLQVPSPGGSRLHARGQDSQPTGPYVPGASPSDPKSLVHTEPAMTVPTERSTRSPMYFRSAGRLAVQTAEALEHAHQLGVVHRDIKPGNLLVDGLGHLWVTDFGLAQFQSDAGLTASGDVVGTLRYMSPEQALAKRKLVDHRTDVYSLGATLYELLTLAPTFRGRDREELLRQIAFEEPRPPRQLNAAIPIDLETIVLKALAKAPEERYGTAQELADDLRRFLEDKPILARRPTLRDQVAKWSRRHKPIVVSAVVLLVMAAVGSATSTILIAREQARTKAAYDAEAIQRAKAERSFHQARRTLDFFTQLTDEELAGQPEMQGTRRRMLEALLRYYQNFIDEQQDDPQNKADLADSHDSVSTILNAIGTQAEDLADTERVLAYLERMVRAHPTVPEYRWSLSNIYHSLDGRRGGGQLHLLSQKAVQEDLKLTDDQVQTVKHLADTRRETFRGQREVGPDEWRQRLVELSTLDRALSELLRSEQGQRLQQIVLQLGGPRGFSDPDAARRLRGFGEEAVARKLDFTTEQKEKIKAILEKAFPRRSDPRGPGLKRSDDYWKGVREKVLATLTADQAAQWQALVGEPFKGEIKPAYPGPGAFPGPPPGPGGHHHRPPERREAP